MDPTCAYAYTLCGHEYFAADDFQKGVDCYRHAIRLDPRHYQAWCGALPPRLPVPTPLLDHTKDTFLA